MPSNSSPPLVPPPEQARSSTGTRLIAAAVLIGLAIGALALVDRIRDRPKGIAPPHEPSQALIMTPAQESSIPAANSDQPAIPPPPPPLVVNSQTLAPPQRAAAVPLLPPVTEIAPAGNDGPATGKAYLIQAGVFSSPANAQALQKQLKRAGIESRLETRVQLGPFKDKRDADKALARARKLGINAVLVGAR